MNDILLFVVVIKFFIIMVLLRARNEEVYKVRINTLHKNRKLYNSLPSYSKMFLMVWKSPLVIVEETKKR